VALLRDEPCADEVGEILAGAVPVVSAVTLAEVTDVLVRSYGEDPARVEMTLGSLLTESIDVESPSAEIAIEAGLLRGRWYRRQRREVSLGDCFVVAAARSDDAIATADPVVAEIARGAGLEVVALPDSNGRRP
jgi:PIN domain nuclease of toxin-antitoxin system